VKLEDAKWQKWSTYANCSPFPNFKHPTPRECKDAYAVLHDMHRRAVDNEFKDEYTPETIPHVLDAMIVAILSQATNWNSAKCAMGSMKETYGSIYAYDKIMSGGREKLQEALKCGGLHVQKSMIIHDPGTSPRTARKVGSRSSFPGQRRRRHARIDELQVYGPQIGIGRYGLVLEEESIHCRCAYLQDSWSLGLETRESDARIDAVTFGCCRAERVEVHAALLDSPAWPGVSGLQGRSAEECDLRGSEEDPAEEEVKSIVRTECIWKSIVAFSITASSSGLHLIGLLIPPTLTSQED
jgi:hypothetical protein